MPTKAPKEGTTGTFQYEGDKETFVPDEPEEEAEPEKDK